MLHVAWTVVSCVWSVVAGQPENSQIIESIFWQACGHPLDVINKPHSVASPVPGCVACADLRAQGRARPYEAGVRLNDGVRQLTLKPYCL